jgi:predicted component of type VI protein secretion system
MLTKLDGNDPLEDLLKKLMTDAEMMSQVKAALNPGEASQA